MVGHVTSRSVPRACGIHGVADAATAPGRATGPLVGTQGSSIHAKLPDSEVEWELLSPSSEGVFQVAKAVLVPGGATTPEPLAHDGEEFAIALDGVVIFEIDGERVVLNPGDSITFDPRLPHRAVAPDNVTATVLLVVTPPTL